MRRRRTRSTTCVPSKIHGDVTTDALGRELPFSGRTAWVRNLQTPLRTFLRTETGSAAGMLALVGPRFPIRLRAFMLTVTVVDDVAALIVIATVYAGGIHTPALLIGIALFAGIVIALRFGRIGTLPCALLAVAAWVALSES